MKSTFFQFSRIAVCIIVSDVYIYYIVYICLDDANVNAIFCLNCRAAKTDHSSVLSLCKMFQICCFTMPRVNFSCAHNAICAKECMVIFIRSQDLPELLDNVHAITRSSFVTSWRFSG